VETPSATVTLAAPAYEPLNTTIFALFAGAATADPTQTAAMATTAAALVSRYFLKVTPFVDVRAWGRLEELSGHPEVA